ncbi:MAG: PIG-L deacetylase family protein [Actinomycetota bacterium]
MAPADGPVLASFAHPDDAEIAAGGTMAKFAAQGREVHLLVLTNGDRGSNDRETDRAELERIRAEEVVDAGRVLGLAGGRVLDIHDGDLRNTDEVRAEIVREIRRVRPVTVLCPDPTARFFEDSYINHRDHRAAGDVTLDAVFPDAGNPLFFSDQLAEGLEPWSVSEVWLAWTLEPNRDEDVSGFMQTKVDALGRHRSQVDGDLLGYFEEWLPKEAQEAGRRIGVDHAESFRVLTLED